MVRVHDVVVIGGGAAGTFAALRLAREGVDVALVAVGPPSALMCRGAAFCGRAFPDNDAFERVWREVLPGMWKGEGTYIGFDGAAFEASRALSGLASVGTVEGEDVLVMDVPGLPAPAADLVAFRVQEVLGRPVRSSTLKLQYSVDDFNLSPVRWARRFDDEERRDELVNHMLRRLLDDPADCVLLPPILGIDAHAPVLEAIRAGARGRVLELCGGNGWPPGLRVASALRRGLEEADVRLVPARVSGTKADGRLIRAVVTDGGDEIEGHRFILATGGLPGGGLRLEDALRETTLGLPVSVDGAALPDPVGELGVDPGTLFDAALDGAHPVLRAGIHVDGKGRPRGPDRLPLHENLWACGSVTERCGGQAGSHVIDPGASALSGWIVAGAVISAGA
jgi:anaerobic glycerol-3-phosphate dehydrogenase